MSCRPWTTTRALRVDRNTSHVFFLIHLAHVITLTSWLKVSPGAHSFHLRAIHDVTCLSVRLLSLRVCLSPVSLFYFFSFTVYLFSVLHNFHNVVTARGLRPLHSRTMSSIAPWR